MGGLAYALWGAWGGLLVAGVDFVTVVKRKGDFPWRVAGRPKVVGSAYVVAAVVRMVLGGGLALGAGSSGYVGNALTALAVGAAAPLLVEKLVAMAKAAFGDGAA